MARETYSHCTDGRGRVTAGLPLFVIGADGDGVADLEQLVSGRAGGAGLLHPRLTVTDLTQRRLPAQRAGVAGHPAGSGAAQSAARRPSDPQDSSAVITVSPARLPGAAPHAPRSAPGTARYLLWVADARLKGLSEHAGPVGRRGEARPLSAPQGAWRRRRAAVH